MDESYSESRLCHSSYVIPEFPFIQGSLTDALVQTIGKFSQSSCCTTWYIQRELDALVTDTLSWLETTVLIQPWLPEGLSGTGLCAQGSGGSRLPV